VGRVEELAAAYEQHISVPWQRTLSGAQRVTLVVYEKELERALRARIGEFAQATCSAGHGWLRVDCTRWFAEWMASEDYREAYFDDPDLLDMKLAEDLRDDAAAKLRTALEAADENVVVALVGVASLYGFLRVSELIRSVEQHIRGRLVVFFPGTKNESSYRLLDARDGGSYLAQAVTLHGGGSVP
jgi:hypothetical protein